MINLFPFFNINMCDDFDENYDDVPLNAFELQLKETLKKHIKVEVEIKDDYGYYGEHYQSTIARVYFAGYLIYSSDYKENENIDR